MAQRRSTISVVIEPFPAAGVEKEARTHTVGLAGHNIFWGSSISPILGTRVVDLSIGRSGFLKQRIFVLGQGAKVIANRLLGFQPSIIFLAIPALLQYAAISEDGLVPTGKSTLNETLAPVGTSRYSLRREIDAVWSRVERLSEEDFAVLAGVLNNPSPEEAADLALMAAFFHVSAANYGTSTEALCAYRGAFCGEAIVLPRGFELNHWPTQPDYFGMNADQKWGDIRRPVWNAIVMSRVFASYPFPSPIPVMTSAWYGSVQAELQGFVSSGAVVTEELGKAWTTLITIEKYNAVAESIYDELKHEAQRERRMAIIRAVGLAAALAIIGYGVGAALSALIPAGSIVTGGKVAQVVTTVIATELSKREKEKAAQDLEKVATLFQEGDAGFAGEVRNTQKFLGLDPVGLAQDELDAINAARGERELTTAEAGENFQLSPKAFTGTQTGDILLVGGIAAASILLLSFLR